ncbi:MAG: hypothetical protein IMW89_02895 [Ktedonobacteraceae bacterium]|nr:hypothetical protein [Ktedonobacteraceae bacterium]
MGQTLVAFDTDHIKQYVFATHRLKEIRGGSSCLDNLNRRAMVEEAKKFGAREVYANGGSGLFLVDGDREIAEQFGRSVQEAYERETKGGASVSFAVQPLPPHLDPWKDERTHDFLELLSYRLKQAKMTPPQTVVFPSHPFMRPCDSCGVRYAEKRDVIESADPTEQDKRYCGVCLAKRQEDNRVKNDIKDAIKVLMKRRSQGMLSKEWDEDGYSYIWRKVIRKLLQEHNYKISEGTVRPSDFNELRGLSGSKDYLALIYADGNGMGKVIGDCKQLTELGRVAQYIDDAVYHALSAAIARHLPVVQPEGERKEPMFPFDILLIGGDDIVLVTPATVAMDVALTLAREFCERTKQEEEKGRTLSVGVVLAPVKYPFGLLHDLAGSVLQFAKQEGARRREEEKTSKYRDARINFLVVAGSTSHDFKKVYASLHNKHVQVSGRHGDTAFYATLRPYTVEELERLLRVIREGRQSSLGRTKLHQIREAVLKMNLSTSVSDALAVLRNWKERQRQFVVTQVYEQAKHAQEARNFPDHPGSLFPRVTFPWFVDKDDSYRTALLDFVELYDFVIPEGGNGGEES